MSKTKIYLSRVAHLAVNKIAWRFAHGKDARTSLLWRINDRVARPSVDDYVFRKTGKTREEWNKSYDNR